MTAPDLLRQLADCMDQVEALKAENAALRAELAEMKVQVPTEEQRWFTPIEAAKFIGRSIAFLAKDRITTAPQIPFSKRGHRTVAYDRSDLMAYNERLKSRQNPAK